MTPIIYAVDPGPVESGWAMLRDRKVIGGGIMSTTRLCGYILCFTQPQGVPVELAIEMIASYGMPVGRDVFETCVQIGHMERCAMVNDGYSQICRYTRHEVKMALCHHGAAKDANINQAVRDRFAEWHGLPSNKVKGTKKEPGPLYGVKKHIWAAVAVAVTHMDKMA